MSEKILGILADIHLLENCDCKLVIIDNGVENSSCIEGSIINIAEALNIAVEQTPELLEVLKLVIEYQNYKRVNLN